MAKSNASKEGPRPTFGGKLLRPSDHLAAEEFGGKEYTLTIKSVSRIDLEREDGKKERAPVMAFEETPKTLVLNGINGRRIAKLYGVAAEGWPGKRITLYPTTCNAFGNKETPCIRVRPEIPPPKGSKGAAAPLPSEVPAAEQPHSFPDGCAYGKPGCSKDHADFQTDASGKLVCMEHAER